jgi:hypothetical protein
VENNNFLETEKTFTVTVTKNPDDNLLSNSNVDNVDNQKIICFVGSHL